MQGLDCLKCISYWCVLVNCAFSTFALTWGLRAAYLMASSMTVVCPITFPKMHELNFVFCLLR